MMAPASAIIITLCLIIALFPPPLASTTLNLWPLPSHISWPNPKTSILSQHFTISSPNHHYLSIAARRYNTQILTSRYHPIVPPVITPTPSYLTDLIIIVADIHAPLQHGTDESYILTTPFNGGSAYLKAATPWGAMRGLETLSQLTWGDPVLVAAGITIRDSPIFPHRGLMVDTSRNFYPVKDLLRTIGAMSMNKMNVFHWHITDSQSFPIVLSSEPELSGKGSYGSGMKYTEADVTRIVEFGFEHGVRVFPEFDTPAHTGSWGEAYPEIVTCANRFWWPDGIPYSGRLASEPGTGQLNPLVKKTYKVVRNVIRDAVALFPERFFHGGCDEVVTNCWKTDKLIRRFLKNGGTLSGLLEKYMNSTLPFIESWNRTVVYWEDILVDEEIRVRASFLPKESVILQTWKGGANSTKKLVGLGYRVIVSSSDFFYLDCGHGSFVGNDSASEHVLKGDGGSWCGPFKTWQLIYNHNITEGLTSKEAGLVLGGEVALWSEQSDNVVMDARIWPRGCALAESLWSGNRDKKTGRLRYGKVTNRLNEWRYRMVGRRVRAEPLQPLWCVVNPGMCNTANSS